MNMYKIKDHPNLSFKLINRVTGHFRYREYDLHTHS